MATITANITVRPEWEDDDVLQLKVGDENGANLATSTPAGGAVLLEEQVGPLADDNPDGADRVMQATVDPTDKCAVVPTGVTVLDPAGNESPVFETFDQFADAPDEPGALVVAATANPNEALLTWSASPDL